MSEAVHVRNTTRSPKHGQTMTKPLQCELHPATMSERLRVWYGSRVGQALLTELLPYFDELLPRLFGFYALQIGAIAPGIDLLAASRIRHRGCLDIAAYPGCLQADPAALPIESASLDLLLLAHSLDFAPDPHQVMREAERSLVPEGHLLIMGFNPMSLFGIWRLARLRRHGPPWCGRFYSVMRTHDWLDLLGMDVLQTHYMMFRPPCQHTGLMRRCQPLEYAGRRLWRYFGGVYLVLARKRVATLTPIKPRWQPRHGLLPGKIAEPTIGRASHGE